MDKTPTPEQIAVAEAYIEAAIAVADKITAFAGALVSWIQSLPPDAIEQYNLHMKPTE